MNAKTKQKNTYSYSFLNNSLSTLMSEEIKVAHEIEPIIVSHIFNFT